MKSKRLILIGILLAAVAPAVAAVEAVKIETVLYLFKNRTMPRIDFSKANLGPPPLSGQGIVISSPGTIVFDREELNLGGADYTWNGGRTVPARFAEQRLANIITPLEKSASIWVVAPVQYLEKMPDGSLQLREVAHDSPDIPHYSLSVTARLPAKSAAEGDYAISCRMDIVTLQGREKITGIDLDVGRPITARFDQSIEFLARRGQWIALMTGQKESGDYTLLVLLKVSPAGGPKAAAP